VARPSPGPGSSPGESRGILHPLAAHATFRLSRRPPSPLLDPFVEHYWVVTWDLRDQQPHQQPVLTGPSVQMTFTPWFSRVAGVIRGQFRCQLQDAGRILGVSFRPGGFRPFLGAPVAAITDTFLGVHEVFGADGHALVRAVRAVADANGTDEEELVALVDRFLCTAAPERRDPHATEVAGIVEQIGVGDDRVADLARRVGVGTRTLQRLFAEYVGVGPKWVSRRFRLQHAAERAAAGEEVDWVRLAADLGYSDQAHFTRDFTAAVGSSPTRYARAAARPAKP
jgi:AraC-like DNA-binding protein